MRMRKMVETSAPQSRSIAGEKLPPYNAEAEEAVLGSILVNGSVEDDSSIANLSQFLKPKHFFREKNGWVYESMLTLYAENKPTDQITVSQQLALMNRLEDIGGPGYLMLVVERLPTSLHALHYGEIVKNCYIGRQIISAAGDIASIGYEANGSATELLAKSHAVLEALWAEVGEQPIVITGIRKISGEIPTYYITVNGVEIKTLAEELISYKKFRELVCQVCDFIPPKMKEEEWVARVNRLLKTVKKEKGPLEANQSHHVWLAACHLLKELPIVDNLDEFLSGKPLEKGDALYVKGDPFFIACRQKLKMPQLPPHLFWSILRERGVKDTTTRIGGKVENCWRIPLESLQEKPADESDDKDSQYLL